MVRITLQEKEYPPLLKEIAAAPKQLFVRGDVSLLSKEPCVAVVGTRKISPYGKQVLEYIIPPLVRAGAIIVSGLAYGVDAYAHHIAVRENGKCIAIFGTGVDVIYPKTHHTLAEKILDLGGALVSEYTSGTKARPEYFPARNRIISGLCKAAIIVEAQEKSGSLITARFALSQNRDVFAVPGNIFSENQKGCNAIILEGAHPLISSENLLLHLGLSNTPRNALSFDSRNEKLLYECLQEPRSMDEIVRQTSLTPSSAAQTISLLELKGLVISLGGLFARKE